MSTLALLITASAWRRAEQLAAARAAVERAVAVARTRDAREPCGIPRALAFAGRERD
ncbi:MAG: hypothetical protein KC468_31060 [Myxococcales bacterium]|nr:hypothetical protein [Myxococcales bacterium]